MVIVSLPEVVLHEMYREVNQSVILAMASPRRHHLLTSIQLEWIDTLEIGHVKEVARSSKLHIVIIFVLFKIHNILRDIAIDKH